MQGLSVDMEHALKGGKIRQAGKDDKSDEKLFGKKGEG